MSNFTRLFLVLCILGAGFSASAQYDLEATSVAVSATTSNTVYPGYQTRVAYVITNTGTATITATQRYARAITVDGNPIIGPDTLTFGADLAASATFNGIVQGGAFLHDFGTTIGDQNICLVIALIDSNEANIFNNSACEVYTVSADVSNDWIADTVTLDNWQDIDGHTVIDGDPAPEVDTMRISITNNGVLPFFAGSAFNITISNGEDSLDFDGFLNASIDVGASTTLSFPASLGIPDVLQTNGNHEMCVRLRQVSDEVSTNNRTCTPYKIIVPPPLGLDEFGNAEDLNIFHAQEFIQIEGLNSYADVVVMDATGKVMMTQTIDANERISTAELASGMYLVRVAAEGSEAQIQRIVKN